MDEFHWGLLGLFHQIPTHSKTIVPKNTPTYMYSKLRRFTTAQTHPYQSLSKQFFFFFSDMTTLQCTIYWTTKLVSVTAAQSRHLCTKKSKAMWRWWFSIQTLPTVKRVSFFPTKLTHASRQLKWKSDGWFGQRRAIFKVNFAISVPLQHLFSYGDVQQRNLILRQTVLFSLQNHYTQ